MASAPLGGTYYPACIVNLLIRFDENFNADWRIEPPPSSDVELSGVERAAQLKSYSQRITEQLAAEQAGVARLPTGANLFDANANVAGSSILGRIPLRASVELNNIRKPGTFNLTFDYKDLPIDPRLVRSVGVEIFMDTVRANDFATGVPSGKRTQENANTSQLGSFQPFVATPQNLVLKGVVDEWSVSHGTSGSTATISGRDMVGVLLNTPVTAAMLKQMATALDKTIDVVIRTLIGSVGGWADLIEVATDASRWPKSEVPIVAASEPRINPLLILEQDTTPTGKKPRARLSTTGIPRVSAGANQSKLNVWDLITRYCNLVAAVPTFEIKLQLNGKYKACLQIVPQWGLYDYYSTDGNGPQGPFNPSDSRAKYGVKRVRRLMYGRNIEELTLERKYQGITARAVEVVSYNTSSTFKGENRLLSAVSSLKQSYAAERGVSEPIAASSRNPVAAGVVPSGLTSQDEVLRIEVKGITDLDQLQRMADGLYEEIMRGETGGSVRTRNLASFGGNNEDPDLLRIRPRDPLELSIDIRSGSVPTGGTSELIRQARQDIGTLQAELQQKGLDYNLSRAVAFSSRNAVAQLQNAFRVNSVSFDWDVKSGISIGIDFHNYIVARDSILPSNNKPASQPSGGKATAVNTPSRNKARTRAKARAAQTRRTRRR